MEDGQGPTSRAPHRVRWVPRHGGSEERVHDQVLSAVLVRTYKSTIRLCLYHKHTLTLSPLQLIFASGFSSRRLIESDKTEHPVWIPLVLRPHCTER
uniref:Uncharacterized protein n=1 Tax=Salix viminalis TaxID=40686 RepID=A0A6N2LK95_SALVM